MSLTQTPERTTRVNRSELSVPASSPRFIDAASRSDADIIFLDLEDIPASEGEYILASDDLLSHGREALWRAGSSPFDQSLAKVFMIILVIILTSLFRSMPPQ